MFLDCICGSTTGGLGLLGLYINEGNVALINQTLETLTEYCQGKQFWFEKGFDTRKKERNLFYLDPRIKLQSYFFN